MLLKCKLEKSLKICEFIETPTFIKIKCNIQILLLSLNSIDFIQ